jgi:hypothetical protein
MLIEHSDIERVAATQSGIGSDGIVVLNAQAYLFDPGWELEGEVPKCTFLTLVKMSCEHDG